MEAQSVTPQRVNPVDNFAEWLDQKEQAAEPATQTGQSQEGASPAEPNVAQPEASGPRRVAMEDVLPEDFEHGFFRNKPVAELVKSFRATETEMQRAQREAKEFRAAAEQLRAEVAARDLQLRMAAEQRQAQPQADPYGAIEEKWFTEPHEAARLLKEQALKEAKEAAVQITQQTREEVETKARAQQIMSQAGYAYDAAREHLKVDPETWNWRAKAVLVELTRPDSPYAAASGPLNPANYIDAYQRIYGVAEPVQVVGVPPPANPPGSAKAPMSKAPANGGLPTLTDTKRAAYAGFAEVGGIDIDKFLKRVANGGKRG